MKCIYCLSSDGAFNNREHVIPQAFGRFGSETPTLKCVCDKCNEYFGRHLDEYLARETLEGVTRYTKVKFSKENRVQKHLEVTIMEGPFKGLRVYINGTNGKLDLIPGVWLLYEGKCHQVDLKDPLKNFPEISPDSETYVFSKKGDSYDSVAHRVVEELSHRTGELKSIDMECHPFLTGIVSVQLAGILGRIHKRALAKIFMNFVQFYHMNKCEILKERWNPIRKFVRDEGSGFQASYVVHNKPFWGNETQDGSAINIRVCNKNENIVGLIQFYNRHTYEMVLVKGEKLIWGTEIAYRFTVGNPPEKAIKSDLIIC